MIGAPSKVLILLVPEEGLEPSQGYPYRILSPARLPFHHSGTRITINEPALWIQGYSFQLEREDHFKIGVSSIQREN